MGFNSGLFVFVCVCLVFFFFFGGYRSILFGVKWLILVVLVVSNCGNGFEFVGSDLEVGLDVVD